jgi:hypothetical protein
MKHIEVYYMNAFPISSLLSVILKQWAFVPSGKGC